MKCLACGMLLLLTTGCAATQVDDGLVSSTSHKVVLPLTSTTTTTGMVDGTPVYAMTTGMNSVPANLVCTAEIATDDKDTIRHYQGCGDQGGRQQAPGEADSTQASGTGPGVGPVLRWVFGLLLIIGAIGILHPW